MKCLAHLPFSPRLASRTHARSSTGQVSTTSVFKRAACGRHALLVASPDQAWSRRLRIIRAASSDAIPAPSEPEFQVFPRIKERDPYRRLGLSREASFEEIQEARNYLYENYKWHEPSREAIELAFDDIIQDKMKNRHKYGFRPVRTGRKTDLVAQPNKTFSQQVAEFFDPTVTTATFVNEMFVYACLAVWVILTLDMSLPLTATLVYSIFKFHERRKARNPDGPFFGGHPLVGAIITSAFALVVGTMVGVGTATLLAKTVTLSVSLLLMVQYSLSILTTGTLAVVLR